MIARLGAMIGRAETEIVRVDHVTETEARVAAMGVLGGNFKDVVAVPMIVAMDRLAAKRHHQPKVLG